MIGPQSDDSNQDMIEPLKTRIFKPTGVIISFAEGNDQLNNAICFINVDSTVVALIVEVFQRLDFLRDKSREYWRIGCIRGVG